VKDQLPNLRLIGLTSSEWGRDWEYLVQEIDQKIDDYGFELAGQDILIEFKNWPALFEVKIYRPVIGPLKEVEAPFILLDWESAVVNRFDLKATEWNELFEEISKLRQENDVGPDFTIIFSRRFSEDLSFNKQVLFR